ncbi:MAG: sugar nucleotide-binding protein [Pseudomonadales bacterium]
MKLLLVGCEHRVSQALTTRLDAPEFDLLTLTSAELERIEFKSLFVNKASKRPDAIISTPTINSANLSFRRRLQLTDVYKKLCAFAKEHSLPLLHLSNLRVFDGSQSQAYTEQDKPQPRGVEAQVWRRWETLVQKQVAQHIIIRPSWVLTPESEQLASELLLLAAAEVDAGSLLQARVNPTSAEDMARVLDAILRQLWAGARAWGIYHYGGMETTDTKKLLDNMQKNVRVPHHHITQLSIAEQENELNACVDCHKILYAFGIQQHPWRGAMQPNIKDLE